MLLKNKVRFYDRRSPMQTEAIMLLKINTRVSIVIGPLSVAQRALVSSSIIQWLNGPMAQSSRYPTRRVLLGVRIPSRPESGKKGYGGRGGEQKANENG